MEVEIWLEVNDRFSCIIEVELSAMLQDLIYEQQKFELENRFTFLYEIRIILYSLA